ncbi:hypothetical protein MNBD_ACTINO02-455 [hydrothermal vent metagenome]|uniref:Uncharacterized protein n=1 Tax=hydrothermal vent metagenome TaxID=652676 RepID=A0A3B0S6F0_9ZZZZ
MLNMRRKRHGTLCVVLVVTLTVSACAASGAAVTVEAQPPLAGGEANVGFATSTVTEDSDPSRSYNATSVVQLTFEQAVKRSPLVMVGEIVSVGGAAIEEYRTPEPPASMNSDGRGVNGPYDFQVLTVKVIEILLADGTDAGTLVSGDVVAVAFSKRADSAFVPETIGSIDTVGLRILIVGKYRVVGFENGVARKIVLASPRSTYVELPSASGGQAHGVRLWTPYSDRRTLASRGALSEAALDAMQYADVPEFSDLLARISGADTRPREQHLGYDQVTRTTLPQPPPGTEP